MGGVLWAGQGVLCHPVLGRTVCGEVREFVAVSGKGLHAPHGVHLKWCTGPFLWGQPGDGQATPEPGLSFRAFPRHLQAQPSGPAP